MSDHDLLKALGSEIRAEAAAKRVPLTQLAKSASIGRVTLYRYLDAERDMPVAVLLGLSRELGIGADVLMTRAEKRAGWDAQGASDSE